VTQAPYPRRYARPVAERCRSSRQHSRSRWRRIGAQPAHPPSVPLHRMHFCRGRLPGAKSDCFSRDYRVLRERPR
jgi:hypothetical protein